MAEKRINIKEGFVAGFLTTICIAGRTNDNHLKWNCICKCGNYCIK